MRHHIMLLFLSDVKTRTPRDEDGKPLDKELLPFAVYKQGIGECGITNESAVRYLRDQEVDGKRLELDALFAFASKMVQQPIGVPNSSIVPFERTHLEFFKERVAPVLPRIDEDGFFQIVSYDEKQRIPESRRFVLEMAERIMAYVQEKKAQGDEVVLHADLTGGLRHAVMLMLAVMRLLQYNGIEIGKVLYSNYQAKIVDVANDIYSLFHLIAGADEFAQSGSVSAILRYFGYDKIPVKKPEHISTRLHNLLVAMHGFAEEIKVCHYGAFAHAVKALSKALHDFRAGREADDADVNEGMIAQLRFRIMAEYGDILGDKIDDVKLLRWCVNHGYLQQALTLFTERVPEILKARDVVTLSPAFASKVRADMKKDDKRSEIFYLFADYRDKETQEIANDTNDFSQKAKSEYRKIMKTAMSRALKETEAPSFDDVDWKTQLCKVLEKHPLSKLWQEKAREILALEDAPKVRENYERLRAWCANPKAFAGKKPQDEPLWDMLVDALSEKESGAAEEKEAAKKEVLKEAWCKEFHALRYGRKKFEKMAGFVGANMDTKTAERLFSDISLAPGTEKIFAFRHWFEHGDIACRIPQEDFYALLAIYYKLKTERNQSNHAREDSAPGGARKLGKLFKEAFRLLEKL